MDTQTLVPDGKGVFDGFSQPVPIGDNEDIAFTAIESISGIYTNFGGTLIRVADETTPIPGGDGAFVSLDSPVALGGGDIVFKGKGNGESGIYKFSDGTLSLVVDSSMEAPMGVGNFVNFKEIVSFGNGDLAFIAVDEGGNFGIYMFAGNTLIVVANKDTAIPMGSGDFAEFSNLTPLEGNNLAFSGFSEFNMQQGFAEAGIYARINGSLSKIADLNTQVPMGVGNFKGYDQIIHIGDNNIAFIASADNPEQGVYTFIDGVFTKLVDTNTSQPNFPGNFTAFDTLTSIGGTDVALDGTGTAPSMFSPPPQGVYTFSDDTLSVVVDNDTPFPGDPDDKFFVASISAFLSDGTIAFTGASVSANTSGIFIFDGTISIVADTNTQVPMGTGGNFDGEFMGVTSLGDGDLTFFGEEAGFPGFQGIYTFIDGTLAKVASGADSIPMGVGDFLNFNNPIGAGGDSVAFEATGSEESGLYKIVSTNLSAVADENTPIPGGVGTFTDSDFDINPVSLGGEDIAFSGIYASIGGEIVELANENTPIPGQGGATFSAGFSQIFPLLDGSGIFFEGSGDNFFTGLYSLIGVTISSYVDTETTVPMSSNTFNDFSSPVAIGGENIGFIGGSGTLESALEGIYTVIDGTLAKAADSNTTMPGGSVTFDMFISLAGLGDSNLAFFATGNMQAGIYSFIDGVLANAVDLNTPVPGSSGNFTSFGDPISIGGEDFAFMVTDDPNQGIYASIDGTLAKLVDTNTRIPGGAGTFEDFPQPNDFIWIGGKDVAFVASGSDDQLGLYATSNGRVRKVADSREFIPMESERFVEFEFLSSPLDGTIFFIGTGEFDLMGIYSATF